jgi:Lysophospholipase
MSAYTKTTFQSASGETLTQFTWMPEGEITGVVQLVHGMAEHMQRYDEAAQALCKASFLVIGHTHCGHGEGAPIKGYFGQKEGLANLLADIHALRLEAQAQNPNLPYFMLGHSMGSFLVRCYIENFGNGLTGAVLSGTGHYDKSLVDTGLLLSRILILLGQGKKPAPLLEKISAGSNNKRIESPETAFDWLSTDADEVQKYVDDDYCGFTFTAYGYHTLFSTLKQLSKHENLNAIPKTLPIYLFAGTDDPVGDYGSGVGLVAKELRDAGIQDVDTRLYKDGRHEMFNEKDKASVFRDLIQWLYNHLA